MTSRRNGFGLAVALSFGSLCLGFSATALAQDDAKAPPASDDTGKPADAPAGTPALEPAKDSAKVAEEVKPPDALPAPTATTASGTSVEREKTVALVGVEELPGSAYPSSPIRGLKYGSLWLTFHGLQWPYMPLIEGGPALRIGFSGSLWNDLSNTRITPGSGVKIGKQNRWTTQTRGVFRVTPTYNAKDGWFVQGNAEFVAHGDMTVDPATKVLGSTDDLWVRVGKWNVFDVTVGRFQGWEIANHLGMGLDQNTLERSGAWIVGASSVLKPTDGYGLTYFWDRQDYTLGAYALHVYPTKYLRGELLGHFGTGQNLGSAYQVDVRPAAIFDIGWLKLKAGLEYGKSVPQDSTFKQRDSRNGYGLAAQFVFAPYVEFGGSFARGFEDVKDEFGQIDLNKSNTVQSYGGFLNASPGIEPLLFGFGGFMNQSKDLRVDQAPGVHFGKQDTNDQIEIFGAAQYTLWDQLYFKFVLSHASNKVGDFNRGSYINNATSGRFRVTLLF
ncbi:MAG: hypothetical protein ABW061_12335 [Polyangiaceae bacterium]